MEDTLRVMQSRLFEIYQGLNPCCNGRYSQRQLNYSQNEKRKSLNPCFNGRYSQRVVTSM